MKTENTKEVSDATEVKETAQPTQEQEQRNVLLGTISYTNEDDYEKFLSNLDLNQSMFVLIAGANHGQSKGLYSLEESELIAKAIKTIKKNSTPTPASTESNS
jgi:hypothetical protein